MGWTRSVAGDRAVQFSFYVHEQALRLPVGGNRVMNEQLLKLVLIGDRSIFGAPFMVLQYHEHRPVVYVEVGVGKSVLVVPAKLAIGVHKGLKGAQARRAGRRGGELAVVEVRVPGVRQPGVPGVHGDARSSASTCTFAKRKSRRPPAWSRSRCVSTMCRTSTAENPSLATWRAAVSATSNAGWRIARNTEGSERDVTSSTPSPESTSTGPSSVSINRQWHTIVALCNALGHPSISCPPKGRMVAQCR